MLRDALLVNVVLRSTDLIRLETCAIPGIT